MLWHLAHRAHPLAVAVADRHYTRQKPGTPQFVPPGRCLVLMTTHADAVWVTSWPFAEYVKHAWAGAWICSLFRREGNCPHLASHLITDAVACTRWWWGPAPDLGMVTMVDPASVRHKRDPGRCFRRAGFMPAGWTQQRHLLVLQLLPEAMPVPCPPAIGANPEEV